MAQADVIPRARPRPARSPVTLIRLATILGLWVVWEGASASGLLYEGVVPSSLKIAAALLKELVNPTFYYNLEFTLMEVGSSLFIGAGLGLIVGLTLGANRFAGQAYERYLQYVAPTPKIVFLPIMLVLFGVGAGSKIGQDALACFFPMALSVASGVRQVDPVLLRVGRSFNLSVAQTVRMIYLPALVAPIATGLRLSLGVAIIGCLLAELKMSNRGAGFLIMQYYAQFRTPQMYAVLIVMFLIAAVANGMVIKFIRQRGGR
jgi:ABC-type nitrate/sulfonate/bicarbonate transport system permease component